MLKYCLNHKCPTHSNHKTAHKLIKQVENGILIECETCGNQVETFGSKEKLLKCRYPHFNASAGVTFNSYSHQREYEKKHKLEPI